MDRVRKSRYALNGSMAGGPRPGATAFGKTELIALHSKTRRFAAFAWAQKNKIIVQGAVLAASPLRVAILQSLVHGLPAIDCVKQKQRLATPNST